MQVEQGGEAVPGQPRRGGNGPIGRGSPVDVLVAGHPDKPRRQCGGGFAPGVEAIVGLVGDWFEPAGGCRRDRGQLRFGGRGEHRFAAGAGQQQQPRRLAAAARRSHERAQLFAASGGAVDDQQHRPVQPGQCRLRVGRRSIDDAPGHPAGRGDPPDEFLTQAGLTLPPGAGEQPGPERLGVGAPADELIEQFVARPPPQRDHGGVGAQQHDRGLCRLG